VPETGQPRLSFMNKAGYGLGDMGFLLVWHGSALFLLFFYTDILGLSPGMAGAIYLIAMIWDAVSDPLVAAWAENRAARTGRYTPIIAWAALPVGLTYACMFFVPVSEGWMLAGWALLTHLSFRTAYTIASMPYNTLPVRLTTDGRERSALSGFRVAGAATGAVITAILTPLIVQASQATDPTMETGYQLAAVIVGLLAAVLLFGCSKIVREPAAPTYDPGRTRYVTALKSLFRAATGNPPLLKLLALIILGTIGHGFFTHTILYFLNHVLIRADAITPVLAMSAFATILAAPVWVILAGRTSKKTSLVIGLITAAAGYLMMGFAPANGLIWPLVAVSIAGSGGAAIPVMLWSMVPDSIEYGEMKTGRRVEARTFGLMTFAQKTSVGLTALLVGGLLALVGYSGDVAPTQAASAMMRAMVSAMPAAIMVGAALLMRGYPIDKDMHVEILARLKTGRGIE
jgi:glycoside/pentoside/hexuronide:cation symporter, GPH family